MPTKRGVEMNGAFWFGVPSVEIPGTMLKFGQSFSLVREVIMWYCARPL